MANESPTQIAREAKAATDLLEKDVRLIERELVNAELPKLRERMAVLEKVLTRLESHVEELKPTREETEEYGALKGRVGKLEEEKKLGDTRLFQFIMLFVGGVITLSVQIILLFFKK